MPGGNDKLNWTRDEAIAVPAAEKEGRIAIRRSDWARVRRNVKSLGELPATLSVWYSVCFSVAASAGVSIIPLYMSKELPVWVTPAYVCATAASAILGLALVFVDGRLKKTRKSHIGGVDTDMQEIEDSFPPP